MENEQQPSELQQAFFNLTMIPLETGGITCIYVNKAAYERLAKLLNIKLVEKE